MPHAEEFEKWLRTRKAEAYHEPTRRLSVVESCGDKEMSPHNAMLYRRANRRSRPGYSDPCC